MIYHYSDSTLEYEEHFNSNSVLQEVLKYSYDADGNVEYLLYKDDNFSNANAYDLYYYVRNVTGDITYLFQVREQNGSSTTEVNRLVAHYEYDPYGNILSVDTYNNDNIGNINPIRYKDYYYDAETGWYQAGSRFYDPEVGRFLNADDLSLITETDSGVVDKNLYAYCDGNPVMRKDNGGDFWQIAAAGIGAVIGASFEVGSQILSGDVHSIKDIDFVKVGASAVDGAVTAVAGPIAGAAVSGAIAGTMSARDGNSFSRCVCDGLVSAGLTFVCGKGGFSTSGELARNAKSTMKNFTKNFRNVVKNVTKKSKKYSVRDFFRVGKSHRHRVVSSSVSGFMSSILGHTYSLARH